MPSKGFEWIEAILCFIEKTPHDASQRANSLPAHVLRRFARETGFSLGEYTHLRRLSQAAYLLAQTDIPILDIALSAGYESRQAFSDAFTRRYGTPPGRFRRNRRFYALLPRFSAEMLCAAHQLNSARTGEDFFMNEQGSQTALMSAFARAWHSLNEETPIFCDRAARALFDDEEYEHMIRLLLGGRAFLVPDAPENDEAQCLRRIINEVIAPTPLCRAAFCEKSLAAAVQTGCTQYVILGAGLDTFAVRHGEFLLRGHVFEVDYPATQADKKRRLARAGWELPDNLHMVPMDFSRDSLHECLLKAGFDPSAKTFFSWLGVSYYLSAEQIDVLFDALSSLCSDGSTIVFDYAHQGFFEAKAHRVQCQLALAAAAREPMKSCFSAKELTFLLQRHGFLLYDDLSPRDIQSQLIGTRCPGMTAFEHIHCALAVYKAH